MAVMDEFREEREALKNGTFKEKLIYFWDYYKWYVIGGIGILLFAGSMIYEIATRKEVAFNAILLNASPMTEDTTYQQDFAAYAGIDLNKLDIFFDTSIRITEGSMDETSYTSTEKLMVYTAAGELDIMASDTDSFRKYANSYTFYDLRNILSPEQLEQYEPYFYYVDLTVVDKIEEANNNLDESFQPKYPDPRKPEEMETPVPVGIYLNDCDKLKETFYFRGDEIVLGVYANTNHLDTTLQYIDFVMADE